MKHTMRPIEIAALPLKMHRLLDYSLLACLLPPHTSWSSMSSNHEVHWMEFLGWNKNEVGLLSMIITFGKGRPNSDRSCINRAAVCIRT